MADPGMAEIHVSDFAAELRAVERRIPLYGVVETTFRCNLNCVHCYVNEPRHSRKTRSRELPLRRLLRLLDEIAEAGCLGLLLTGGEVFVRPDFPDLYSHAVRQGLRVTVFTNGTRVTDRIVRLFRALTPARVEITLNGITRGTYERISRVAGSFDACMRGVMRLHENGIPLGLKTTVMTWNEHEVPRMRAFAQQLGVGFRHDGLLNPRLDGCANGLSWLQLPAERVVGLDLANRGLRDRQREATAKLLGGQTAVPWLNQRYSCGAGLVSFTVDPYGELQLCQLARRPSFSLRENSFERGWNEGLAGLRARPRSRESACRGCTLLALCGSCPGASQLEHGDPERPVEQFCRITHLRADSLLGRIQGHRADARCCLPGRA